MFGFHTYHLYIADVPVKEVGVCRGVGKYALFGSTIECFPGYIAEQNIVFVFVVGKRAVVLLQKVKNDSGAGFNIIHLRILGFVSGKSFLKLMGVGDNDVGG